MATLDELAAALLLARFQLSQLEGVVADARKAAHDPNSEVDPQKYLKYAADLAQQADLKREEVEGLRRAFADLLKSER